MRDKQGILVEGVIVAVITKAAGLRAVFRVDRCSAGQEMYLGLAIDMVKTSSVKSPNSIVLTLQNLMKFV